MYNIPEIKLGIVAVSRDSFPIALSEKRRSAIKAAYKGELYKNLDEDGVRRQLSKLQKVKEDRPSRKSRKKGGLQLEQEKK
jgi:diadenylate cyclase